jgi:Spy/CpxP family protein refolding chaperone
MKMNFAKSLRAGSVALTTLLATFTAMAQDAPTPAAPAAAPPAQADGNQQGGRGNRGNNNNIQRGNFGGGGGFNLDDKQRELLLEARQVNGDDLRKLNEKLADAQKEFIKAVVAEKYDEKVVREKADAVGKIQAEILALNGKAFATVSPTLKPEQRESIEGNVRIGIAVISPDRGFGGGGGLAGNFAGGGGRGNFQGGGDAGLGGGGFGGRGGARDAGPGQDRTFRRGGNGGAGVDGGGGNNRRRGDNPAQ